MFPPDPSEGAGDFNLLQGLNVANALEHTLPQNSRSAPEGAPFDKFLFVDGSGFIRTQNLQDFDEWASRSATTLLTCETVTGKTFFDVNEMLNEIAPYNNLALICVGGGPEDRAATEWLHDTDDKVKRVQAGEARAGQTTKDIVSEELPSQLAIEHPQAKFNVVNEFNALKEADAELDAANEQLRYKRRNLPKPNMWIPSTLAAISMAITFPVLLFFSIGIIVVQLILNDEVLPTWMTWVAVFVCVVCIGGAFFGIGYFISWILSKLKQRHEVSEAIKIRNRCRRSVREELEALGAKAHEVAENLSEYWSEIQFARMWVMPDTNDPSLPLGGDDRQRMDMNERLGQALRYTINPMIDLDKKIKRCTVIVAGSPDAREKFPLPGDALIRTFGGSWEIRAGQGDIDDSEPIHYLMLWEPDDNRILPRFYRERSGIKVSQMPAEYNAWPIFTQMEDD